MKIYSASMYGNGTLFVTPGSEHPENIDWVKVSTDAEGRTVRQPIQFAVKFRNGETEVPDGLGRYLLDKKMASASRVIVPTPPTLQVVEGPKYAKPIPVGRPLANAGGAA